MHLYPEPVDEKITILKFIESNENEKNKSVTKVLQQTWRHNTTIWLSFLYVIKAWCSTFVVMERGNF